MIKLERTNSESENFKHLTRKLDKELKSMYGNSQDEFDQFNIIENIETVVIAYQNDVPAGCGCFKKMDDTTAELKRMYVDDRYRGLGVGSFILHELETWAAEKKYTSIVLETGTIQSDAIRLYTKKGYSVIPNFDPYIGNVLSICFKKDLTELL